MIKPKSLLVTIFTHNRNDAVAVNLMGLYNQTYSDFDIMIVDDSSKVPITESKLIQVITTRFKQLGTNIHFRKSETNNGIAKNRAILLPEIKKYDYAMDLNDDHFLEPRTIEFMVKTLNRDDVCCVGSATPFFFQEPVKLYRFYRGQHLNSLQVINNQIRMDRDVDYIYIDNAYELVAEPLEVCHASQCMYKSEYLNELPMDYSVLGFSEETDMCLRLKKNSGKKIMFQPDAINWHMQLMEGGIREVKQDEWNVMYSNDRKIFEDNWTKWIERNQDKWPIHKGEKWWETTPPDKETLRARCLI